MRHAVMDGDTVVNLIVLAAQDVAAYEQVTGVRVMALDERREVFVGDVYDAGAGVWVRDGEAVTDVG